MTESSGAPHRRDPVRRKLLRAPTSPLPTSNGAIQEVTRLKYGQITDNQIRLLQIHRGELNDKITLSIETVVIDKLGLPPYEYEALSYHGGERWHENPIFVQNSSDSGQGETTSIHVKANLYTALQHLRMDDAEVLMWVDAICINQHDKEEKTAQIARMWEIYRNATRVCIWLGEGKKSSYDAMRFITEIVDSESDDIFRDKGRIPRWRDLADLMRNDWFSRRWVVQEVALAKEASVHYGQEAVHWDDFRDAISLVTIHSDTIQGLFETVEDLDILSAKALVDLTSNIFRNNKIFEPTLGLEYLVSALYAFKCSDPRDTIFALRNIACETSRLNSENQPPEPDYKKGLLEVYRDFVRWAIQTSKSLDIVCRHWALPEQMKGENNSTSSEKLPSWIQVMEGPGGNNGVSFVGLPGRSSYNASYKKAPEFRWSDHSSSVTRPPRPHLDLSLCVKGLIIGQITWTSNPITKDVIPQSCLEKAGWAQLEQPNSVPDKLWRTLVADRGPDGGLPPRWYHRACLYCLINNIHGDIDTNELLKTPTKFVKEYLKRVQAVIRNRKFLEAKEEGLFGLCSSKAEPNDIVCILFGCSVPVVLRVRDKKDGGGYLFVEEAYIYGKMDGEAITALTKEELAKKTMEFRLI
ncbi:Heterokaryon incompatibility protein (HET) domain containing protein [Elaphomyces granulatus]